MSHRKRIAVIGVLITVLLANFWLGSRYPSIDEKAAMAGEVVMGDVLSFDAHFPVAADDPLWRKIGYSTLNWTLTNRQGMTFGVLLAALILTLLRYWRPGPGRGNPFADAIKGVVIGTPLGVCVNCAAPIAFGMRKQGLSAGTSLATMFASPTLNIIVLAMTFSLLPLYMGVTKVAVTLFFIVVLLPLLVRAGESGRGATVTVPVLAPAPGDRTESWFQAIRGLVPDLWRSFLFIVLRTVPLMLLAGLLGATMAHLIPLESLGGWQVSLTAMAAVALVGTFAPVPIAFDVVIVQALLMAGLPPPFAMVLLLTLGLFSIYPFMLVARMQTLRLSVQLFLVVTVLGFTTGYGSLAYEEYAAAREARLFAARFEGRGTPAAGGVMTAEAREIPARPEVEPESSPAPRVRPESAASSATGITWRGEAYAPRSAAGELPFTRHSGRAWGLRTAEPETMDFMLPFSQGRGIAAADFDGDGWPDLAVANNNGLALYRNIGGKGFEAVPLGAASLDGVNVVLVAFADFNDDGCPDLYAGAVGDADFIVANDCNGFAAAQVFELPHEGTFITQAAAFADIDADGDLDILRGSWFFLIPRVAPSPRDRNYLALNQGAFRFEQRALDEIHGETLSVLWSDLDANGLTDMVIGNDYQEPDIYYRGKGAGEFERLAAGGPVPISTNATMSIDSADIDNDGEFELFLSGKVNDFSMRREVSDPATSLEEKRGLLLQHRADFQHRYCALFEDPDDQDFCRKRFVLGDAVRRSTLDACSDLPTAARQDECMITIRIKNALVRRDWSFCPQIPADEFPVHRAICEAYAEYDAAAQPKQPGYMYLDQGAIPQKAQGNVLLVRQPDGNYADLSEELGVDDAVWAWNARFADLDLDGWQDLYVVNGWWLETSMYSNVFFHNQQGEGFAARQKEFGLENFLKQHAFVHVDIDRDGDLDIITRSLDGRIDVYINNSRQNHAISFEFRDELGNHHGIGNRVMIRHGPQGDLQQIREIKLGGGFLSFDPPVAHFGLGADTRVERVEIDWIDGETTVIDQPLEAGFRYVVSRRRSPD